MDGALDLLALQSPAGHDEMEVDPREDLGVLRRARGGDLHHAIGDGRAALPEDVHHVVGGAAAGADQHRLHRPWPEGAPAAFRRTVHHHGVPPFGLADEGHVLQPLDADFHHSTSSLEPPGTPRETNSGTKPKFRPYRTAEVGSESRDAMADEL